MQLGLLSRVFSAFLTLVGALFLVSGAHAAETITYTYDALGRLIEVESSGDVNDDQKVTTSYDAAGNRTNQTVTGAGPGPANLAIGNASVTEGGNLEFTVTRTGNMTSAVSASFTVTGVSATSGTDFTMPSPLTVSFAANDPTKTITVATIDDSVVESAETLTVTLSAPIGGAVITTATGTGTINDNDTGLSIGNASVTEGGNLAFTVTRTGVLTGTASVGYASASGTATSGSDFTGVSDTLNFAANEATKTITVTTIDDSELESAETMTVTLSGATGAVITGATGTGTINDNDAPVSVSISVAGGSANEGSNVTFTVSLSAAAASDVTVAYATQDGTALAGSDYNAVSDTLTFTPGQTSKMVTVTTIDDSYTEDAETFSLVLSSPTPSGATIGTGSATGTINASDSASVTFSIGNASVTEGGNLTFTITKSGFSFSTLTVYYNTVDGTAIAGSDYTAVPSGSVSFNLAQNSRTITIATLDDSIEEPTEQMSVILTSSSGGSGITNYTGVGTINDNDAPPPATFAIGNASATEGGALSFTVTRSGTTTSAVSVDFASASGTATSGSDFPGVSGTLNFAANETSKVITVNTTDDSTPESAETMTVTLSNPSSGSSITTATGTGTINDNDAPATLAIGNASVTEGGTLSFTVTRSGNTSIAASADYATANGTATAGSDYTSKTGTVSFAASETTKTITVSTTDDSTVESAETMTVTLSSPSANTTITTATGIGTINDNDTAPATLAIGNASVTEGGTLTFTVTRSGNTGIAASANYATANGTATAGSDYTAASGTVSFTSGQTSKTITVATIDDSVVESAETMTVTLSSPSANTTITTATGTGTINDNDVGGWTNAIVPQSYTASTNYSTYTGLSGTGAGMRDGIYNTSASIHGTNNGSAEWVMMNLGSAQAIGNVVATPASASAPGGWGSTYLNGAVLEKSSNGSTWTSVGTVTSSADGVEVQIAVNDTVQYLRLRRNGYLGVGDFYALAGSGGGNANLAIGNASVTEGGTLSFTVTRSGNTSIAASANYATANGTATAGSDYTSKTGTVSFAASETSKTITVNTTDDSTVESAETMTVTLSSPSANTTITTATGTGTINDNDTAVANIAIGNASVTEGGSLVFTVTRSGTTSSAVSVSYASSSGTATSGSDFTAVSGTLSFSSGQTSKTITVNTTDDSTTESAETMTVTLSSPSSGATITTATGTGTINDNDGLIQLTNGMTVLSGHTSTYICQSGYMPPPYDFSYASCRLSSNNANVYYYGSNDPNPYYAQGYSWQGSGLAVTPTKYGTADP